MSNFPIVDSIEAYDALLADHCLPASETTIAGVPRHKRFEECTPEEISGLNEWFLKNGTTVVLRIASKELCLHILGAKQVDQTQEAYNLELGKAKEKIYYWCAANAHNRIVKQGNLGSLTKEGLIYDMVNQYYGLGPAAHIDAYGWILSLQHRLLAWLLGNEELGDGMPPIDIITIVGMPPQLAATLDRGAPKTKQDQEFIDREQFSLEFLADDCDLEYIPENKEKLRNELAGYLVTVRNNLWSRLHGTGYHPSSAQSPSTRQALALQSCFAEVGSGDELQRLIVKVWERSIKEDGKKGLWVSHLSIPMVVTAIVLASNSNSEPWDNTPLAIDNTIADTILGALGTVSDEGSEGYSSLVREIAKIKKQPKKPSGLDRWVFWAFVSATAKLLAGEYDSDASYFPTVNESLVKRIKNGKQSYPIFGGVDVGPKAVEEKE